MRFLFLGSILMLFVSACTSKTKEQTSDTTTAVLNAVNPADDWECVAGEKAGIITAATSEQQLMELLGKENVSSHDTVYGAEGFFSIGTILYKGTPNETHIVWKDTVNFRNPEYVEVGFAEPSDYHKVKWYTNTGIKAGTKLTELEEINGRAFKFSGFGWDYGGAVIDWAGGKLSGKDNTSYLSVIMAYDYENPDQQRAAEKVLGDSEFSSTDPNARLLNPFVSHFIISFR